MSDRSTCAAACAIVAMRLFDPATVFLLTGKEPNAAP